MNTKQLLVVLVLAAALALYVGYSSNAKLEITADNGNSKILPVPTKAATPSPYVKPLVSSIELRLPAVDKEGNGVLADLTVEKSPGNGGFYLRLNQDSPLTNPDTQASMKTAFEAAKRVAKVKGSDSNLYYSFNVDSDAVGGKSAGAAMAVASIALLRGEGLRPDTLITGTIEADGRIGRVGKVLAKAKAAKKYGFRTLIVPKGEAIELQEVQECSTEIIKGAIYHSCHTTTLKVDVANETGLTIIEAENAVQAYDLMKVTQ